MSGRFRYAVWISSALIVMSAVCLLAAGSIQAKTTSNQSSPASIDGLRVAQAAGARQQVCSAGPTPWGWIIVDDLWDPTRCGNPTSESYNIHIIERFDNKPEGAIMRVCGYSSTPPGWAEIEYAWDPGSCGHPSSNTNNVKSIKKMSPTHQNRRRHMG